MEPNKDYLNKLGYETRDVVARTVGWYILGLFVFLGVTAVVIFGIYSLLLPPQTPKFAGPFQPVRRLPPNPRIQPRPVYDLRVYQANEDTTLKSYALDHKSGKVRLPIDRAIDLLAQRGLPIEGSAGPGATAVSGGVAGAGGVSAVGAAAAGGSTAPGGAITTGGAAAAGGTTGRSGTAR